MARIVCHAEDPPELIIISVIWLQMYADVRTTSCFERDRIGRCLGSFIQPSRGYCIFIVDRSIRCENKWAHVKRNRVCKSPRTGLSPSLCKYYPRRIEVNQYSSLDTFVLSRPETLSTRDQYSRGLRLHG